MSLVFDSSAFVKLVVDEEGSRIARDLWKAGVPLVSALVHPEAASALRRAIGDRRFDSSRLAVARDEVDHFWRSASVIDLTKSLAQLAGQVAMGTGLKGADAVHLATALTLGGKRTVLVTWDRVLSDAARANGLAVAP